MNTAASRGGGRPRPMTPFGRPRIRRLRTSAATLEPGSSLAGWAFLLGAPRRESRRTRVLARVGIAAIVALAIYLAWGVISTIPEQWLGSRGGLTVVVFEALPLLGLGVRLVTLWNLDCRAPAPVTELRGGTRVQATALTGSLSTSRSVAPPYVFRLLVCPRGISSNSRCRGQSPWACASSVGTLRKAAAE